MVKFGEIQLLLPKVEVSNHATSKQHTISLYLMTCCVAMDILDILVHPNPEPLPNPYLPIAARGFENPSRSNIQLILHYAACVVDVGHLQMMERNHEWIQGKVMVLPESLSLA